MQTFNESLQTTISLLSNSTRPFLNDLQPPSNVDSDNPATVAPKAIPRSASFDSSFDVPIFLDNTQYDDDHITNNIPTHLDKLLEEKMRAQTKSYPSSLSNNTSSKQERHVQIKYQSSNHQTATTTTHTTITTTTTNNNNNNNSNNNDDDDDSTSTNINANPPLTSSSLSLASSTTTSTSKMYTKKRSSRLQLTSKDNFTYQLGEKIGKGGSAEVHQALNLTTGQIVAVKTIKFSSRNNSKTPNIQQTELDLLKKLVHANIVKYVDSIRTSDSLHIVLEYMENGSLRSLCDRFDGFSESLVAIYMTQALHGLCYLHEQGVLHRDIKGANILTTKDGSVKLADFGVALSIGPDNVNSASEENDVVGSPYWMAPEIIEMAGATAACDIWSLGCTIIELLTGKPPYMELDPMAALFRIVQDDHPPLPDGCSKSLNDFLLQCFKKDPTQRKSAKQLLNHPWLRNPQSHIKRTEFLLREGESGENGGDEWNSVIETLRSYKEKEQTIEKEQLLELEQTLDKEHTIDKETFLSPQPKTQLQCSPPSPPHLPDDHDDLVSDNIDIDIDMHMHINGAISPVLAALPDPETLHLDRKLGAISPLTILSPSPIFKSVSNPNPNDMADLDDQFQLGPSHYPPRFLEKNINPQYSKLSDSILSLLASLNTNCNEKLIVDVCIKLLAIFKEHPQAPHFFLMKHGVVPIMDLLEVSKRSKMDGLQLPGVSSVKALPVVLQVVNKIIENNQEVQEHLSLVGMIPAVVKIAEGIYAMISNRNANRTGGLHLEAAKFVDQICNTSQLTLQMFIAGGGLPLLVKHITLASDLQKSRDIRNIVGVGINGILKIFSLATIRRIDFCHLFVNLGLLPHLVIGFRNLLANVIEFKQEEEENFIFLEKIGVILTIFSQSDPVVKERMAVENVLLGIVNPLISLTLSNQLDGCGIEFERYARLIVVLLKCIRSLVVETTTLNKLDRAQAIVTLMPLLERTKFKFDQTLENQALESMFYLCRIDKTRQELAARNGLIPYLKRCILEKSSLMKFSLPLICDMAHTSNLTREELWRNDGVEFYLRILNYSQYRVLVLNALTVWLANDIERVEPVLMLPSNTEFLINTFIERTRADDHGHAFEHEIALLRIIYQSRKLAVILGQSKLFVSEVVERIKHSSAYSRKTCLSILTKIIIGKEKEIFMEYNLFDLLNSLTSSQQIIISEMAKNLLGQLVVCFSSPSKKSGGGGGGGGGGGRNSSVGSLESRGGQILSKKRSSSNTSTSTTT